MTARVQIDPDGRVLVRTGKVELGQGLHTALAQIVASELGLPLARVHVLPVDTDSSPDEGVTSGSLSVQDAGAALRAACVALRSEGNVPRRAPGAAASDDTPCRVGTSALRRELPGLFAGAAHFIHDLAPEGLLHGRVLHPPHPAARVVAWDESAGPGRPHSAGSPLAASAPDMPVRAATWLDRPAAAPLPPNPCDLPTWLRSGALFGAIAATSAEADAAFARLADSVQWQQPDWPDESADALQRLPSSPQLVAERGMADAPPAAFTARYTKPWIAHAALGPSCALARWQSGRLDVWSHSQGIFNLRRDLALAFAIGLDEVCVHHVPGAGCYGHNGADDVAFDAAWLARAVPGRTVRVLWSRADELSHAPFGPAMAMQLSASLDAAGRIACWEHAVWSPGHSRRPGRSAAPALLGSWQVAGAPEAPPSIDMPMAVGGGAQRNAVPGYDFAAFRVRHHSVATLRRSSALRSLGAFGNVFAAESFIDEIAHASGADPLAYRQRHLQHDPRALRVLGAAAASAGWGERPREDGVGRGIAYARYKGSGAWCAVVAEVHAGERLRVRRLSVAVDVGQVVNPDGVVNQIEGGAIQATSWALLESAAPAHAGWGDYPILKFTDVPTVDVRLIDSAEPSLGVGEASLGPTGAAIANALFDALGVRVRDLPLTPERIVAAMGA